MVRGHLATSCCRRGRLPPDGSVDGSVGRVFLKRVDVFLL